MVLARNTPVVDKGTARESWGSISGASSRADSIGIAVQSRRNGGQLLDLTVLAEVDIVLGGQLYKSDLKVEFMARVKASSRFALETFFRKTFSHR